MDYKSYEHLNLALLINNNFDKITILILIESIFFSSESGLSNVKARSRFQNSRRKKLSIKNNHDICRTRNQEWLVKMAFRSENNIPCELLWRGGGAEKNF